MKPKLDQIVSDILLDYAQNQVNLPLDKSLSIRRDLAIDSLSLVSIMIKLSDEIGVDMIESEPELGSVHTVGDLLSLVYSLQTAAPT